MKKAKYKRLDGQLILILSIWLTIILGTVTIIGAYSLSNYFHKQAEKNLHSLLELSKISSVSLLWSLDEKGLDYMVKSILKSNDEIVYLEVIEGENLESADSLVRGNSLPEGLDIASLKDDSTYIIKTTPVVKVDEDNNSKTLGYIRIAQSMASSNQFIFNVRVIAVVTLFTLILILATLIKIVAFRVIRKPVHNLVKSAQDIADGKLETPINLNINNEIGLLGNRFDDMRQKLLEYISSIRALNLNLEDLVEQKTSKIKSILDNIELGIATFDESGEFHEEHSKYLEVILNEENIEGKSIYNTILENANLDANEINQIQESINISIHADEINFAGNSHLLPNEIIMKSGQILSCDWNIITKDSIVTSLIIILKDITSLKQLQEEFERSQHEMKIIGEILNINPTKFESFIGTSIEKIDSIAFHGQELAQFLRDVFILIHTIKGNARTFALSQIVINAHECETLIKRFEVKELKFDVEMFTNQLNQLRDSLISYKTLSDIKLNRQGQNRTDQRRIELSLDVLSRSEDEDKVQASQSFEFVKKILAGTHLPVTCILDSLHLFAEDISKSLLNGITPKIITNLDYLLVTEKFKETLEDILGHLTRNSIAHGIESSEIRVKQGKSKNGNIYISLAKDSDSLQVIFFDDGRGLDLDRIRDTAIKSNLISSEGTYSDQEIADLIFTPGFSTTDEVSMISGRGVGLDAVKSYLADAGGSISLDYLDHCKITITLPKDSYLEVPEHLLRSYNKVA